MAVGGLELGHGDAGLLRSGGQQHPPCDGTGHAQLVEGVGLGGRAAVTCMPSSLPGTPAAPHPVRAMKVSLVAAMGKPSVITTPLK